MFSVGVLLFIIVQGIFPFAEASEQDYYYKRIHRGDFAKYWEATSGESLSHDFKDLIMSMFSHDPSKRPTITDLKNHPWMKKPFGSKAR